MNSFNKITVRVAGIMLILALVALTTGITIFGFLKNGGSVLVLIAPVTAIVYGCVAFFKKYYPGMDY